MRKFFAAGALAALPLWYAAGQTKTPTAEHAGAASNTLPDGPGKQLVLKSCQSCHSLERITSKRGNADDWAKTVSDMIGRGANLSDDDAATVVEYLTTHFGVAAPQAGQATPPEKASASASAVAPSAAPFPSPSAASSAPRAAASSSAPAAGVRKAESNRHLYVRGHAATNWSRFGNEPGAERYSPLTQINTANVDQLQVAWKFDTTAAEAPRPQHLGPMHGDSSSPHPAQHHFHLFRGSESEPLVVDDVLYMSTGYGHVVALNAETGEKIWDIDSPHRPAMRGVSYWPGTKGYAPEIVYGTMDGWLIALDAKTGKLAPGFGAGGMVDLKIGQVFSANYPTWSVRSPVTIYKNYVLPGCFPGEKPASGGRCDIRAFDLRTGKLVWTFHTVPQPGERNHNTWKDGQWENRSGVNNWGYMSVDAKRGLIFVPLGSPNTDFYGGDRAGLNLYGNSIVALDANTGKLKWYFQTVHHDNWDYDDSSAPILITVKHGGKEIPAVAQTDKDGYMYILNRETGKPIYGVKEVPIKNDNPTPGDSNWPTEPIPVKPPPLARETFSPDEIATVTPEHEQYCKALLALEGGAMTGGPFAQYGPKLRVIFPGWTGGTNWGGGAYDPKLGYIFIGSKDLGNFNKLVPDGHGGYMRVGPDHAPPDMGDYFWDGKKGWPCQQPPWGRLFAVNVNTGEIAWQVPLGSFAELDKLGVPKTGTPLASGGGIATAGGLVFIGATADGKFRAFDERTGKQLWETDLNVTVNATPITWMGKDGKQYVAVMAGGTPHNGAKPTFLYVWSLPDE